MRSKNINLNHISEYKHNFRKCGAISCINNIQGNCNIKKCELYENVLIQED